MDTLGFIIWSFAMMWVGFSFGKTYMHGKMLKRLSAENFQAEERYVALYRSFVERGHVVDALPEEADHA